MKKAAFALILVIASIALVACGGSSSSSSGSETSESTPAESESGGAGGGAEGGSAGSASTVNIEADPSGNLAYTSTEATAKAGKVTIDFTNPQPLEHDVAIESSSGEEVGKTELTAEGSTSTVVNLKPGTYKFFCTVPGHRQAGMEGTLTVK
ncbi:MAG TPA: plastocyanin/azurin family copper-binding protein [Solirubrobacterales bacterium]